MKNLPLLKRTFSLLDDFIPQDGFNYLFREHEERSKRPEQWINKSTNVEFYKLDINYELREVNAKNVNNSSKYIFSLRSIEKIKEFLEQLGKNNFYLDITSMPHMLWMPLLRVLLSSNKYVKVVYTEPLQYRFNSNPIVGESFDLSERIEGVKPIPTFTTFKSPKDDNTIFVPLLGFEGVRFSHIIENVQPIDKNIYPIIGIPGFHIEYPFHTYHNNHRTLKNTDSWKKIVKANALCPYSAFYKITEVYNTNPNNYIKIAPIGTKPHALGAVLFHLKNINNSEMIYDHPKIKSNSTNGIGKCHVYNISEFMKK